MNKITNEEDFIKFVKQVTRSPRSPFGIGDDAAILPKTKGESVIATDFIVEGIDFRKKESLKLVARKALAINLSDLAAMGAEPKSALLYIGFPKNVTKAEWKHFFQGWNALARQYKISLIGGDVSRSPQWMVGAVLIGEVTRGKSWERSGARAGDSLWVTGTLGGSLIKKHLAFTPRVKEALFLKKNFPISSCIDLSDGLAQDLNRLLKASRKGIHLELCKLPASKDSWAITKKTRRSILEHIFTDGEDFELLFTLAPRHEKKLLTSWKRQFKNVMLTKIGKITKTRKIHCTAERKKIILSKRFWKGFDHVR